MEEITNVLVGRNIDTTNAHNYAKKLWEHGVTTPGLLGIVDQNDLAAAGITTPMHIKAILSPPSKPSPPTTGGGGTAQGPNPCKSRRKHLLFFSYIHAETATEMVLFHDAAQSIWPEASIFQTVDHNNLHFDKIIDEVQDADNFVVLLSSSYIKFPYTIVELVYALRAGANVVAVHVVQQGKESFDFQTMAQHVKNKDVAGFFDEKTWELLASQGIEEDDVCNACAHLLNVKAPEFFFVSHAKSVRDVMIGQIFKGLRMLDTPKPNISVVAKPYIPKYLPIIETGSAMEIVQLLKVDGDKNAELAAMCCEKLGLIAKGDNVGRMQLVNAGACEAVVVVLRAWMKTDAFVVQLACVAIRLLSCEDKERALLGGLGACEAVITALIAWGKTEARVAQWGCSVVGNLSARNDANKTRLGESGACEAVVVALTAWGKTDAEVAGSACRAVGNLSVHDANCSRLGNSGACEAVVAALLVWGKTDARVAERACDTVRNLAHNNSANIQRLINIGVVAAVQGAVSYKGRDVILTMLSSW